MGRWLPTAALLGAVALLVLVPTAALLGTALEDGPGALLRAAGSAAPAIAASAWSSLAAALIALVIGGGLAFLTERSTVPGRRGLRLAMLAAFVLPGYVAALGWLAAYGPGGLTDDFLGLAAPALVGPLGVILVMAVEAAPIVFLIAVAGLAMRAEPDLERAARAAGAGPLTTFRTITLPLLLPSLGAAGAIAFVLSVTSFGVPAVLGIPAGFTTMTTRVYRDLAFSSDPESFVRAIGLALLLAVGAVGILLVSDALLRRSQVRRAGTFGGPIGFLGQAAPRAPHPDAGHSRPRLGDVLGALLAWLVVVLVIVVPLMALLLTALTRAPGLPPLPSNWSLDSFAAVLDARTLSALLNSALLAAGAALGVVLLSGLAMLARRGPGSGLTGALLGLGFALPGSTLAVAVMLAYGVALRDTLLIILVAYLAKFWALGHRPMAAGLDAIPADLYRAARASGASASRTLWTVALPLLRPLIVAGALIVFLFGLHEVTISSLLHGPGTTTLAVVVLGRQQLGEVSETAALALLLALLVALAGLPLLRLMGAIERLRGRR